MSDAQIEGLVAGDWERFFHEAGIRTEQLDQRRSAKAKAVRLGKFLAPLVGSPVQIEVKGRTGTAVLRAQDSRGRQKRYYIEVRWDAGPPPTDADGGPGVEASAGPVLEDDETSRLANPGQADPEPLAPEPEQPQDTEPELRNEEAW